METVQLLEEKCGELNCLVESQKCTPSSQQNDFFDDNDRFEDKQGIKESKEQIQRNKERKVNMSCKNPIKTYNFLSRQLKKENCAWN